MRRQNRVRRLTNSPAETVHPWSGHKLLEHIDVPTVVSRLVNGGFGDEGSMREAQIIEQNPESPFADGSFADVLVAVELRSASGLGVVTVDDSHVVQANGCVEMLQRFVDTFFSNNVVSGDVRVTGVDAGGDGDNAAETVDNVGDLLEAAPEGEFGAGGIFNKDSESGFCDVQALSGGGDGGSRLQQSGFAIGVSKRAGMENEVISANHHGTLDFSPEGFDGFLQEELVGAG